MLWNWIIDHIPLWGWLVIVFGIGGVILAYAYPVLLPIWRILPTPVKVVLAAAGAIALAFLGGRYRGRANAEEEQRRRDAEAIARRTEVDRDVDQKSGTAVDKELRDRWSRDPP